MKEVSSIIHAMSTSPFYPGSTQAKNVTSPTSSQFGHTGTSSGRPDKVTGSDKWMDDMKTLSIIADLNCGKLSVAEQSCGCGFVDVVS
eukprot:Em0001g3150a